MIDKQLGEFGEQEARARYERALLGAGARFEGFADKGLDLLLQFESPGPERQPLHFAVQVKTGDSYARLQRGRWHIQNLDEARFRQWTKSRTPVLFTWVRPVVPAECYWALVKRDSSREHFTVGRRAVVTPTIRYDLAMELARDSEGVRLPAQILRPPLTSPLRAHAKEFYRRELLGKEVVNPVAGPVTFTWNAWRHLTRRGRKTSHIHQSLQLLSVAKAAVRQASRFAAIRRISHVTRGEWTVDTRLIALRGVLLQFVGRAPADVAVVLREQIWYPTNWSADVRLHARLRRIVTFHSIYEKVEEP